MRLKIEDIMHRHKGQEAYVCGHGPSLSEHKDKIIKAQSEGAIRFSPNNWYNIFGVPPTYWILSNTNYNISKLHPLMNKADSTVVYSIDGDPTTYEFSDEHLTCDYLPYDQRHFKERTCLEIMKDFGIYFQTHQEFTYFEYGNNPIQWEPPRTGGPESWAGFDPYCRCCPRKIAPTIQEALQNHCAHFQHYSTGDTVLLHAIAFAILMGCNPIYISGMDLDYSVGYENQTMPVHHDHANMWQENGKNLINDLRILNQSAKMLNIDIINLTKGAWYGVFDEAK